MKRLFPHLAIALITLLLAIVGCRSGSAPLQTQAFLDLSGRYHSTEPVGTLGILTLEINIIPGKQRFKAWLAGPGEDTGVSEGIGTVGDGHVILNFDRGLNSDFYFEGLVDWGGEFANAIIGNFIFPDRTEPLPVSFDFVEPVLPVLPDDPQ